MYTRKASRRNPFTLGLSLGLLAAAIAFSLFGFPRVGVSAKNPGNGKTHFNSTAVAVPSETGSPRNDTRLPAQSGADAKAEPSAIESWVEEELSGCAYTTQSLGAFPYSLDFSASALLRPPLEHPNGWLYPAGSSNYQYIGWLSFNPDFNGFHLAQDMANPLGDPVYAVDSGDVIYSSTQVCGYGGSTGQLCSGGTRQGGALVIQHRAKDGTWFTALYGHLNNPLPVGRHVYAGDTIGTSNNWNPPHVHFGIRPGFNPPTDNPYRGYTSSTSQLHGFVDPINFLNTNSACKNGSSVSFRPNSRAPVHPNGTLVKSNTDPTRTVYVIRNGRKQGITSPEVLRSLYPNGGFDFKDVVTVAQDELDSYSTGEAVASQLPSNSRTHAEGRLIKNPLGEVSIISDGIRRPFGSAEVFLGLGYLFCNVVDATAANYDSYTEGPPVTGLPTTNTCNYSITPSSRSVGASGGSGSVSVSTTSGCSWTATSNVSWITITGGGSGSGNGTISYSVAANTGSQRTGTINVSAGGQNLPHTVTQDAGTVTTLTPQEISDHANQLSTTYKVPSVVIKALLEQESGWRQFNTDGSPVINNEPDGRIGIGLTQVTVPNTSSVTLTLGVIQEGTAQGSNPFTTSTQSVVVDVNRLKTDWQYNMQVGVRVLVTKKVESAGAGDDASILENWYYPLAYYNGAVKGGANDPNNTTYSRTVSTSSDWKSIARFPYQECVFNIIAQLYPIPSSRVGFFGPPIKVTLPGPSAVGSGMGQYSFVEPVFCFYDWAVYTSDGTVRIGNWGNQNNGCISTAKTRTGITVHKVSFGPPVVSDQPPPAPSAVSPGTGTEPGPTSSTTTPTFQWSGSSSATRYSLFVSKFPYGSGNIVYSNTSLTGTSFTIPSGNLVNGEKYRWNMTASNAFGESAVSNTLYFTVSLPVVTQTLTVASSNPANGVGISVSPADTTGAGGGTTQFSRTYNKDTSVSLTAPATAGGNNFQKWQRGGVDWSNERTTSVVMDANYTMTAVYVTPPVQTRTLLVSSSNPASGVSVAVSPNDNSGVGGGTTQFSRIYNDNASVSLTASATAAGNNFQKWQRDGVDWSFNHATTVTMDANHTMTAVYVTPPPVTRTLTIGSSNPFDGLGVAVSPNDVNGQSSGTTQFTRTYTLNTSVTLTAPLRAGVNNFQRWLRDGVDFSTSLSVSVMMDADHTLVAVYVPPADNTAPALTVTSHADGQAVTTGAITLAGTASDAGRGDSGVSSVTVNGVRASGDTAAGVATANWSISLTLNPGANGVTVIARDNSPAQNQTTRTLTINYQPPRRVAFDYDGDGRADVAVWRKSDGNWYISNSSNGVSRTVAWGSQSLGDVPVGGDFDGDGRTDVAVWRASTGEWLIQNSSNGASRTVAWGSQSLGDVPVPGDYDGDRRTDVAVWRASTGAWLIQYSSTGGSQSHALGDRLLGDVPVPADFDGDGRTDPAVWRASTGTWHVINSTNGASWSEQWGSQSLGDVPAARDYDGDGRADVAVWRKSAGTWLIHNSSNGASRTELLGDQSQGDVPVPADYDGDGRTDLGVWRASTGVWHLVNSSNNLPRTLQWGSQSTGDVPLPAPQSVAAPPSPLAFSAAYAAQSGDFDGDHKTDVAVWRKSNGTWYVNNSSNNSSTSREWGTQSLGDVPVTSDYDGDGRADIAVWRASNGTWFIYNSATGTTTAREWGSQSLGDVPVPADFDGDHKADIAVWRASTGTWFISQSSNGALREVRWGDRALGDIPVPGDFDGDGRADLALWRAPAGTWHILNSSTGAARTVSFGVQSLGDVPVPGDYDGDGRTDVAVWRASNGTWHVSHSSTGVTVTRQWGDRALGDVPAPGDFDGDGRDDFAVWRASTGTWHVSSSATSASTSKQWGSSSLGDTPTSAIYVVIGGSGP